MNPEDMTDEQLEEAFLAAKAAEASPEIADDTSVEEVEVIDNEEIIADELEQPTSLDSDNDADVNLDGNDTDKTSSESTEGDPDKEPVVEEEKQVEDVKEPEDEAQPANIRKFKANGLEYEFTDEEMSAQFPKVFGQAMDYTKKMQQIKPWRKTIDALQEAKLGQDDINLFIDMQKGDKDAIGEFLKRQGIDTIDLEPEESNYVPKDYGRDENALALKDVVDEISSDPEYSRTQNVLANEWDSSSWDVMANDPKMIKGLHIDMQNGMYDKVQPIAAKLKVYDGGSKSDLDYYKEASGIYYTEEQSKLSVASNNEAKQAEAHKQAELQRVNAETVSRNNEAILAEERQKAAIPKKGTGTNVKRNYLSDSDDDFDDWYNNLQSNM